VAPVVNAALEAGITFFDTSDSYGESERRLRRALYAHSGPGHPLDVRRPAYRHKCVQAGHRWLIASRARIA